MLYIVLAYLMLFAALSNDVCLCNASFLPMIQSINRVYFQTKCEQSKQININQISLIIIMHW